MNSRRSFIKTMGQGAALSAFAPQLLTGQEQDLKNLRIGIIGAENSHTIGFGKMFNIDKKFPA
ncbi:MAG: hypothetical protein E4H10_12280, partial [Bacteroidia bacterium]